MALPKHKYSLNVNQIDSLLAGVNLLVNMQDIPVIEIDNWLAERDEEIDRIVAAISLIAEAAAKTQNTAIAAVTLQITAEETSSQTTQSSQLKPQNNPAELTANRGKLSQTGNSPVNNVEQRPTQLAILFVDEPPVGAGFANGQPSSSNLRESAQKPKSADRVVRVNAENLNRIMGLAGESLVEAKWLEPFADSLLKLRTHQGHLKLRSPKTDSILLWTTKTLVW